MGELELEGEFAECCQFGNHRGDEEERERLNDDKKRQKLLGRKFDSGSDITDLQVNCL